MMESKLRHDFLNNCLRIEILNRLLSEAIEKNSVPQKEHVEDLAGFLNEHLNYLEKIKKALE
jgi:hypothetical protein